MLEFAMFALTIDPTSVLDSGSKERYWGQVRRYLSEIFGVDFDYSCQLVGRYAAVVDESPVGEQVAVYHAEPIETAYDLAVQAARTPAEARPQQAVVPDLETIRERYDAFEMPGVEHRDYRP
jgi:hypothetical protein